jgi:hypothetical protein
MLKGHYELIARVVREFSIGEGERRELAYTFARELTGTNPAFNYSRFIDACVKGEGK